MNGPTWGSRKKKAFSFHFRGQLKHKEFLNCQIVSDNRDRIDFLPDSAFINANPSSWFDSLLRGLRRIKEMSLASR